MVNRLRGNEMIRHDKKAALAALMFLFCLMLSFPSFAAGQAIIENYVNEGPGAAGTVAEASDTEESHSEVSLGIFKITGYCSCDECSGGKNLTYSGTVPVPNHTISADLAVYPLGTKLRIGDVIYTVEDKGSAVNSQLLDIYYATHEEALAKGTYKAEVFLVP
jgi:3D (Asp-Asp-Asp) domain-containing protein